MLMDNYVDKAIRFAHALIETYGAYGVYIAIVGYIFVPELQRFIFTVKPLPGTKVQSILECAKDIRYALGLHLVYPHEEEGEIRIAVSEHALKENRLLNILQCPEFTQSERHIPIAPGYDLMGNPCIVDLAKLIHLLIVGPSGTGKSVALRCIILCIITACFADDVKLLLFDIGANSLTVFEDVAHLYYPVIKDTQEGANVLRALVDEVDKRVALESIRKVIRQKLKDIVVGFDLCGHDFCYRG